MFKILYITYDGLTDPLGQSQVLPYLKGLSQKGYDITILSCEKKENFNENKETISEQIKKCNLKWEYIFYLKNPPILSTILNIFNLRLKAFLLHKENNFNIIHCRSYIASLIGLEMKKKFNTKFIFDMRGFWADERVEGGLWNLKNPLYKLIYKYFKKKEIEFLTYADYTISLTEKAKQIIHTWKEIPHQPIPIEVIPCCTNLNQFSKSNIQQEELINLRKNLRIQNNEFILTYHGSIGTWYLLDEMLLFYRIFLKFYPNSRFLFITSDKKKIIYERSQQYQIPLDKISIVKSSYNEIPKYLSLSNANIFFIKPSFSKSASSPVKMGEALSMNIPIICNSQIGDIEKIIKENDCGVIIDKFTNDDFKKAIQEFDKKNFQNHPRQAAETYFSLDAGIELYHRVYTSILNNK